MNIQDFSYPLPPSETKFVAERHIYKAKYRKGKKYNCYMPALTGDYKIVDCWICDEWGNIHPGYNVSPVPVNVDNIGKFVRKVEE